ncbi:hypothetical protein FisN_2Lh083 [Fistulifera solaris]|uniref:Membrane insertase YidC/Oxa/ALB C-terminal domain-containing protein n=1 Tax=Fistulifera solaris TaxID=1519565 RepID=A0A1Z5JWL7_FISSO|nr:hypothetical protein FisN_2Lh083 [Fistulifera solaris]|eukprot:GAX18440.1 hypothetical protein FisN_2Lh083 [Fistulifera solaris]
MRTIPRIALGILLAGNTHAWVTPRVTVSPVKSSSATKLSMDPNEFMSALADAATTTSAMQDYFSSSTVFLADGEATGWWGSFINIFKIGLEAVHSAINPPLQSMGVEYTWGISIAVFTFLCRLALVPLSIQQSQSAEYMKLLRPYTAQIKERLKDNQDAQNRAIGKLYEDAKQNPLAGCFVSLAQLPIFLGLYRGVRMLAVEGELQEPFLWIPSLEGPVSAPDFRGLDWLLKGWDFSANGPVPPLGWETTLAFLLMPVILVVLQGLTMRVLTPAPDSNMSDEEKQTFEQTQNIMKFLPLMIGFFSTQVPAGLTIYWFMSNLFTLSQSLAVRAYFAANPPKIELPEYWENLDSQKDFKDMTPEERKQAMEAGIRVGPTMDELADEARFHVRIERRPFREETRAWKERAATAQIPRELASWAAASSSNVLVDSKVQQ